MFNRMLRRLKKKDINKTINTNLFNQDKNLSFNIKVSKNLNANKNLLNKNFHSSSDVVFCELESCSNAKALLVYIDGLVNDEIINRDVIGSFIQKFDGKNIKKSINAPVVKEHDSIGEIHSSLLEGMAVIFIEEKSVGYSLDTIFWESRQVEEPDTESVVRGPREGFVETLKTNKAMLRRKIRSVNLIFDDLKIGSQTDTKISIAYINNIVDKDVLKEVQTRLKKIHADSVLDSGYIEQLIEDNPTSPLSTIGNTQKPDIVAGKIIEGRVAILCDGSPHVLTIPQLFIENIQTSEDYYMRPIIASILRLIRIFALFISIFLPALYVALQTFHQEMIPTILLITMAGDTEGIPLPALAEALLMVVTFELLRESGTRLPRPVGSAISIVSALIIGEAAVDAGIVSSLMVIVIAATAVASFIVPSLTEVMTIYRFVVLILSGTMGLYGLSCGLVIIVTQAVSLHSFGVEYTSPLAPIKKNNLKDFFIRFPLWKMERRLPPRNND